MSVFRGVNIGVMAGLMLCAWPAPAVPEVMIGNTKNLYGKPGLIDLPTAEAAEDAELSFTSGWFAGTSRNTLSFQILPRVTGSFRYSSIPGLDEDGGALYDRSFDLRFQILDEGTYRPAVAIGLNDFIGTGVYSSEYIVATKSLGPKLRLTGGLGWGRLGSYNDIGSPFGDRPPLDFGLGGKLNEDQWFRGPASPFGGISWQATDRLTLKAEYSTDAYVAESGVGEIDRDSPWNLGLDYRLRDGVNLSGYYLYGSEVGVQLSFAVNPRKSAAPSGNEPGPLPVLPRPARHVDPEAWGLDWADDKGTKDGIQQAVAEVLLKDGIVLHSLWLDAHSAEVRVENQRFGATPQALGHVARVMTRALPASVETITVTPVVKGIPNAAVSFRRSDLEALEHAPPQAILQKAVVRDAAGPAPAGTVVTPGTYPKFTWSLTPYTTVSLFDPDNPVRADFGARLKASYDLAPGLVLSGSVRKKIVGNLDSVTRPSDSVLPRVRSDFGIYDQEGDPALETLTAAWYSRPGQNLYGRVTMGYLEQMYGGVSGELLWKPVNSRLALGAEVNYARQRDFDQLFGFQDYDIVTGHASAYYDFGNGFHGQVDAGRYLAGDWGATISIDREFANGWRVGAYATFTDVSEEEFGEGSFDKGIRLTIPFGWVTGQPSTAKSTMVLKSLTRDGGARLDVDGRLYERVRDSHMPELEEDWGRFWR